MSYTCGEKDIVGNEGIVQDINRNGLKIKNNYGVMWKHHVSKDFQGLTKLWKTLNYAKLVLPGSEDEIKSMD